LYSDSRDGGNPAKGKYTLSEVTNFSEVAELEQSTQHDTVRPCDIKGILHSHSRWTDGAHSLASMVATAREIGLEYLGVSDHFLSETHQDGLDVDAARVQRQEVQRLRERFPDFEVFQGIEIDVNQDGTLPIDDGTLELFDFVIAAFPGHGKLDQEAMLRRVVAAAANPKVNILGKPVGDFMLRGCQGLAGMETVLKAAVAGGKAVEIDANPNCPEIDWTCCRMAQELGVYMVISPDAHRAARLVDFRHGAQLAHDAGLICGWILNTKSSAEIRTYLGL
jgi:DNA polymerase (family 10)